MSKELKVKVTLDVKGATKKLDLLAKKINALNKSVNNVSNANMGLTKQINNATKAVNSLNKANTQAANSANKIAKGYKKTESAIDSATKKLKGFLAAYTGVMALRVIIDTSDTITSTENRLNALNGNDTKATQETMDKVYGAAQRSRSNYADMLGNVSKSMTLAPDAFQGDIDNAIRFQEIMAKTYALGGASAAEQSSSLYQMMQALGSGILQGDELRSVREGAPLAYKAIEEFAQGVLKTDESLKDLAADGKITSDIVVAAMLDMGKKIDTKFKDTQMTFAQAWEGIKNTAVKSFEPVLQQLNDLLNSDSGKAVIQGLSDSLTILANIIGRVVSAFSWLFTFMYDNWNWIKFIVYGVGIAIVGVLAMITANLIANAVAWIISLVSVHAAFFGWVLVIVLILAYLSYMTEQTGSLCEAIVQLAVWVAYAIIAVLAVVLAVYLATGTIMLSIPMLIALSIIAIIAVLLAVFLNYTGEVVGGIYVVGAWFKNVWFTILNIGNAVAQSLGQVWENFKQVFWNVINSVQEKFWSFVGTVTEGILKIANLINKVLGVFGLNIDTSGLESMVNKAKTNAEAAESKKQEVDWSAVGSSWKSGMSTYDTWGEGWASNAYDAGFAKGESIKNSINSFGNKISEFSLNDKIKDLLNVGDLPDPNAPSSQAGGNYDPSGIGKNIGKTADNTGKMADSMELTQEDLEYLRKVADMEWKKEFTTANITIDMSNYNTINGDGDLDGIVTRLTDKLYEEMDAVANGVYV